MFRLPLNQWPARRERAGNEIVAVRANDFDANRPSIVMVHGIGVSSVYFIPLAQELSTNFNIFLLDLPGYGSAPKPENALTITQLADIVGDFLEKHTLTHVTLLGHSMGCQIAAHVLENDGEDVDAAILLGPTVNREERTVFLQAVRLVQDLFREPLRVTLTVFREYLRMGVRRYTQTTRYMIDDPIEQQLKDIVCPTLVVHGEKDPIAPRTWLNYLETLSPHITGFELPHAPHALQFSHAPAVAREVTAFIKKIK